MPPKTPSNIILIGFMGSGKTTVGRTLAEKLRFKFVDTDDEIVRRAGKPITAIFADSGEEAFRDLETATLKALASRSRSIISTGGGIILRPENRSVLKNLGFTVWLSADEDTIFERVSKNRARPLVQTEDPRKTIHDLLTARLPLYKEASHLTIDTSDLDSEEIAFGIKESALHHFSMGGFDHES